MNFPHLVKESSKNKTMKFKTFSRFKLLDVRCIVFLHRALKNPCLSNVVIFPSIIFLLEIHLHIKNSNYFISEKKFSFSQTTFFERFEATIQRAGARLGHGRSEWLKLSRYKNCLLSVTVHLFATNARKGRNAQERCTSDTFYKT